VGTLLSKEAVGSYAMAASMCAAWNMVGMSIVQAWAPKISGARTISHQEYIRSMRQLLIVVLAISIGGASILSISSEMIFLILLGEQFLNSAMIFSILVWSSVFVFLGVATSQIIVNERIYWVSLVRTALGLVFSLVVIYFVSATWSTTEFAFLVVFTSALATTAITFSKKARQTIGQILKVSLK
jgi:O-antigen/teichoic acid export membrane protein